MGAEHELERIVSAALDPQAGVSVSEQNALGCGLRYSPLVERELVNVRFRSFTTRAPTMRSPK